MKKIKIALISLLAFCGMNGCKKDDAPVLDASSLVRTYTENIQSSAIGNSITTYTLTYDADNRVTSMASIPNPPAQSFFYAYPSKNSFTLDLYEHAELNIHEVYLLNGASKIDSTFQFNNTGDTTTEKYIYNGGQLNQQKTYDYFTSGAILSRTTNYTYDNAGNVIKAADSQGKTVSYTYYSDLANSLHMGQTYFPQTILLVKTETLADGGPDVVSTHFYTFDDSKRLIKDSISTAGVDLIVIKSYTY